MEKKNCLLVLGMHRSGTSALTKILNNLGADLPKSLIPAGLSNSTGHWESQMLAEFNDELLASAGTSWDDWSECTPGWFKSLRSEEFLDLAKVKFEEEFGNSRLMVMKDPRICRILPFWLKFFELNGIEPSIIIPLRNPLEVAESLVKRDGSDKQSGLLLWLRHVLDAEIFSRGRPRIFYAYDNLLENWGKLADEIENTLGVRWPKKSESAAAQNDKYLSSQYRHHTISKKATLENPRIHEWIKTTYRIFDNWNDNRENEQDYPELDRIRDDFTKATGAFIGIATLCDRQRVRILELENETAQGSHHIHHMHSEIGQRELKITQLNIELSNKETDIEIINKEIFNQSEVIASLNSAIDQKDNEIDGLKSNIEQINSKTAHEVAFFNSKFSEQEEKISSLAYSIDQNNIYIEQCESQFAQLVAKSSVERAELGAEINVLRNNVNNLNKLVEDKNAEIVDLLEQAREKSKEIEIVKSENYFNLSSLRQKVAELEDTHKILTKEQDAHILCKKDLEHTYEVLKDLRKRLNDATDNTNKIKVEIDKLRHDLVNTESKNKNLSNDLNVVQSNLTMAESSKNDLILRLLTVQQNLDESQAQEIAASRAREHLIEQITLEERPYFSLKRSSTKRKANLLRNVGIVDEIFYKSHYTDVAASGMDPTLHYVKFGIKEGRKPRE